MALRLPATVLDRAGRGDLLSRVGADVAAIGKAAADVLPTVVSAILLAGAQRRPRCSAWTGGSAWPASRRCRSTCSRCAGTCRARRRSTPASGRPSAARSQLLMESVQGVRTVHAYRLERRHLAGIAAASATARDLSVGVFTLFTRFVGRINRAELIGLAVDPGGRLLVRPGRLGHGRRDGGGRGSLPPALQPDVDDPVHLRRDSGGGRQPGPAGRCRHPPRAAGRDRTPGDRRPDPAPRELRLRRARAGAARHQPAGGARRTGGPGRLHRCRQDHGGLHRRGHPAPALRHRVGGRGAGRPARARCGRHHQSGGACLRRPADRGRPAGPARRPARPGRCPRSPRSVPWTGPRRCRTVCSRRSARGRTR